MSKKTSPIKGPPQKATSKAPDATKPVGGGYYVPREPTLKGLEELPKKIPGCPQWINSPQLKAYTTLSEATFRVLIKKKKLKAYTPDDTIYYPYFDNYSFEDLRFGLVDVLELENQGLLYLDDSPEIDHYRKAWKKGLAFDGPIKKNLEKSNDLKKDEHLKNPAVIKLAKEANQDRRIIYDAIIKDCKSKKVNLADSTSSDLQQAAIHRFNDPEYKFNRMKKEYIEDLNFFTEARHSTHPRRYFRETILQQIIKDQTHLKNISINGIRNLLQKIK